MRDIQRTTAKTRRQDSKPMLSMGSHWQLPRVLRGSNAISDAEFPHAQGNDSSASSVGFFCPVLWKRNEDWDLCSIFSRATFPLASPFPSLRPKDDCRRKLLIFSLAQLARESTKSALYGRRRTGLERSGSFIRPHLNSLPAITTRVADEFDLGLELDCCRIGRM